jgi:hypothetical protein
MAKKKVQKDKQWSTKHTYKTKDRVTRTILKLGVNSGAPDDEVRFVLDQYAELDFYSASSLKQDRG